MCKTLLPDVVAPEAHRVQEFSMVGDYIADLKKAQNWHRDGHLPGTLWYICI